MRRPAYGNLLLTQYVDRLVSREDKFFYSIVQIRKCIWTRNRKFFFFLHFLKFSGIIRIRKENGGFYDKHCWEWSFGEVNSGKGKILSWLEKVFILISEQKGWVCPVAGIIYTSLNLPYKCLQKFKTEAGNLFPGKFCALLWSMAVWSCFFLQNFSPVRWSGNANMRKV